MVGLYSASCTFHSCAYWTPATEEYGEEIGSDEGERLSNCTIRELANGAKKRQRLAMSIVASAMSTTNLGGTISLK